MASVPPVAQVLCESNGGRFNSSSSSYSCVGDFRTGQLTAARAVCEHAAGGTFIAPTDFTHAYVCFSVPV
jgi:hypothetical protein